MNPAAPVTPRVADTSAYYSHQHPEAFLVDWKQFYHRADEQTVAIRQAYPYEANVLYGDHRNQILDIYYPAGMGAGCPVMVFLHGGSFREGHPAHYGYLAEPFLEHQVIFVSAGYRLIPECYFPESAEDIAEALAWVYFNIGQRGGDPNRIVLGGHSAGAMLSASLAFRAGWQRPRGLPLDIVKRAVLISGHYDLSGPADAPIRDQSRWAELSPICTIERVPGHTITAFGPDEKNRVNQTPGIYAENGRAFAEAVELAGGSVSVLPLDGLDHPDTAHALGDRSSPLFEAVIKRMLRETNQ